MRIHVSRGRMRVAALAAVAGVLLAACGTKLNHAELQAANGPLRTTGASGVGGGSSTGTATADSGIAAGTGSGAANPASGASGSSGASSSGGAATGASSSSGSSGAAAQATSGGGGSSGGASAASGGTKSTIVFGSFGTASGALGAVTGPAPPAIRAWVSYINAKGGLNGHPVEVVIADVAGDPVRAKSTVRQFVEERHVAALFNDFAFTEKVAVMPYLEQVQVPLIGTIGGDPVGDHSSMDFNPLLGPDVGQAWGFLDGPRTFTDKGKLGAIYCREAATCSVQMQSFRKLLPFNNKGVEQQLVYEAQASLAQPDFTAEVLGAKQAGVEVLLLLMDSASVDRIAQAAKRQGYAPIFAGTYNLNQDLILRYGSDLEGLLLNSRTPPWDSSPKMAFYRDAMDRYQPGAFRGDLGGGVFVVGAMLEKLAPQLPNTPTAKDFLRALYSLHGETLGGLLPGITFNQGEHAGVNQCVIPMKLVGGRFQTHDAAESFVCAPGWKPGI